MIYDTTIESVYSKVVNRKSDGRAITIFEITDSNGTKWTTSRKDLAGEANRLLNQRATVQGREEQKGEFLNHYLEDVRAANGSPPAPPQAPPHVQQNSPPPQIPQAPPVGSWTATEKDFNIMRQTAAKVSAHLSHTPAEFWSNVDDLVDYFAYGTKPERFLRFIPPSFEDDPGPDPTKPEWTDSSSMLDPDSDLPF